MKSTLFAIALFVSTGVSSVLACSCPQSPKIWWDRSSSVALVRVDSVTFAKEDSLTRSKCEKSTFHCVKKQIAKFTVLETYKGSTTGISTLATPYGGGDCGMPLLAGTYYVIFLRDKTGRVGICQLAGPYLKDAYADKKFDRDVETFLKALRSLGKGIDTPIPDRPSPIPLSREF